MRIGISNACFYSRLLTEQALEYMGKNGVKLIEVFLDTYSEYTPEFGRQLAGLIKDYGMTAGSVHAMTTQFEPQLFSLSVRQRADAERIFISVLEQGQRLGADKYIFHGQATMGGVLKNAQLERIGPITERLCRMAGDHGLKFCWENVSWCLFCRPGFAQDIASVCPSDNLRFCLDIKQAARSGYEPFDYLKAMGDKLAHVHLLDYTPLPGARPVLRMPPEGSFDFERLACALKAMDYKGDAVLECYSDLYCSLDEVVLSRDALAQIFARAR